MPLNATVVVVVIIISYMRIFDRKIVIPRERDETISLFLYIFSSILLNLVRMEFSEWCDNEIN